MTDEDIERSLRRFRITGPPLDLRRRVGAVVDRQRTRRDAWVGCAVAAAVVLFTCLGSWTSWAAEQRRLSEAMVNPEVAREADDAGRALGAYGRVLVLRDALERSPSEPFGSGVVSGGGSSPW